MQDDVELLLRYARDHDEAAFSALVERHLKLVYAAALRQAGGDAHLAEDIAQNVFSDLARKAGRLAQEVREGKPLVGWLHTSVRYAAGADRRTTLRRQLREHAMSPDNNFHYRDEELERRELAGMLDDALARLPREDRDAVLLRYFEGHDLRAVGAALGWSEAAAGKRVQRALQRVRQILAARGITSTVTALAAAMEEESGQAIPAGLAAKLSKTCAATATGASLGTTLGGFLIMSAPHKTIALTAALLLTAGIAYRASHPGHQAEAKPRRVTTRTTIARNTGTNSYAKIRRLETRDNPGPRTKEEVIAGALEKIRAVLKAPGRVTMYPQKEMQMAIIGLREHYREAIPLLREALKDPDWEVRVRAAGGLGYLSAAAAVAVPDLIKVLGESSHGATRMVGTALASIGVAPDMVPEVVAALRDNADARATVELLFPFLLRVDSPEARAAAEPPKLGKLIADLKSPDEETRINAMTKIGSLGPMSIDAIAAVKAYIAEPGRQDQKVYAEAWLTAMDPDFQAQREDPAWLEQRAERAKAFEEKMRTGNTSVEEMVKAMRELPEAIPAVAERLGNIGYQEMSRLDVQGTERFKLIVDVTTMLLQITSGNLPLEARLAASDAYAKLQPSSDKLLYTTEEAAPAMEAIQSALTRLDDATRDQVKAQYDGILDQARTLWVATGREGEVTDYNASFLRTLARELAKLDRKTHDSFVAAMRKSDPNFLRRP